MLRVLFFYLRCQRLRFLLLALKIFLVSNEPRQRALPPTDQLAPFGPQRTRARTLASSVGLLVMSAIRNVWSS